jgi:hypothetical protein
VPTTYNAGADCELSETEAIDAECNTDAHVLLGCEPHATSLGYYRRWRKSVIEKYAPIHDPNAAKQTYFQFLV